MKYTMIIEKGENNYSAYLPDLPGCIATGKTVAELKERLSEAIEMHIEGMIEDGLPIPEPNSEVDYVEIAKLAAWKMETTTLYRLAEKKSSNG